GVAAGTPQMALTAAAFRTAREMRRVPGPRRLVVAQALPVVMAEHRRPLAALRPVAAGPILSGRERGAVRLPARQDVVHVGRIAPPTDRVTLRGERRLLGDVVLSVQVGEILGDDDSLGVLPGAGAKAVAGVDRAVTLRAQIRVPGPGTGTGRLGVQLTDPVRPGETPEVAALS